jgi:hypothetical protein
MRRVVSALALVAALSLLVAGCGGGNLRTRGRVVKDGQPLLPKENETVRVTFVPILADGKPPTDHFHCEFNREDGTFQSAGKDKKGMPPGKYRVAVEFKRDRREVFGGAFDEDRSPFVFDIDSGTPELVIDLNRK